MGRTKSTVPTSSAKFKGRGEFGAKMTPEEIREAAEDASEQRKKRKQDEKEKEQAKWVARLKARKFTCERQIDRTNMGAHPFLDIIEGNGLQFFFRRIAGYRKKVVQAFYEHMIWDIHQKQIRSAVGGAEVTVSPDVIARYLGNYARPYPYDITFPRANRVIGDNLVIETITEDPETFDERHNKFISGGLKELPRIANKIVHYNICPRSIEKTPTLEDGKLLFVFCSDREIVDWAEYIFDEIVHFRTSASANTNIPFPAMITSLCLTAGCRVAVSDPLIAPSPGPLTEASIRKSKSLSRAQDPEAASSSRPTSKSRADRQEEWFRITAARQDTIQRDQRKIKKKQSTMMKILRWLVCDVEERTGKKYKEEEQASEEDSDNGNGGDDDDDEEEEEEEDE